MEITRGPKDLKKIKADLAAAGYNGEKIVVLAATTLPNIWAEAQVATDLLTRIGFNVDMQALEWGTVVQRRASREPIDKGGWNIFYTYLGGFGNVSPAPNIAIRGNGTSAWFGWPTDPKMEALYNSWFEAPDVAGAKEDLRRKCKRSSGKARLMSRWACTTSRPRSTSASPTCRTVGRNSMA